MNLLSLFNRARAKEDLDTAERGICLSGGTILTAIGMKKGGIPGLLMSIAGGSITMAGITGSNPLNKLSLQSSRVVKIKQSVLINKDIDTVYNFWRDIKNFPRIMKHIKKVEVKDRVVSHWVAEIGGIETSWDAEIVYDYDNWKISWSSLEGSNIQNSGKVEFYEAGYDYTLVEVMIAYEPKMGLVGFELARALNQVFAQEVREDLMNAKQVMEQA